jgi:hypothetical protein
MENFIQSNIPNPIETNMIKYGKIIKNLMNDKIVKLLLLKV